MKIQSLKKLLTWTGCALTLAVWAVSFFSLAHAAESKPFELIPEANPNYGEAVKDLGENKKQSFRKKYQYFAESFDSKKDVGSSLASWIMTRDTIFLLLAQIVKVLANVALVIGAGMIVYAGYLYVISVYSGDNASKANGAIKRALIGIVVVIFSFALIKIMVNAFL